MFFFKLFNKQKYNITFVDKNERQKIKFWYDKINECLATKTLQNYEKNILKNSFKENKILRMVKDILFEYDVITKELYLSSLTGSQPDFTASQLIKQKNV
jgi:hypothetical protein